jgi:hypothetical protein
MKKHIETESVSVTVTEFVLRGKKVWRLRRRIGCKIERRFFASWGEAEQARHQTLEQLSRQGTDSFENAKGMTVSKGIKDFMAARRDSLRGNHLRLVEWWLGEFAEKFGGLDLGACLTRAGTSSLRSKCGAVIFSGKITLLCYIQSPNFRVLFSPTTGFPGCQVDGSAEG